MRVNFVGDLKIKEEDDGVTFSWQGLEYSETPVTQERLAAIQKVFEKYKPDDPLLVIEYVLTESCDIHAVLEMWYEGEYAQDYVAWVKKKFRGSLNATT